MNSNLQDAFAFAEEYHATQKKNGTERPMIYHPLAVASLVLKYGGNPAQAKAALIHDVVAEGKHSEAEIAKRFGPEVARLAFAFADPELPAGQSPSWRALKEAYLAKLKNQDAQALVVVACEELHDLTELLHDLKYQGVGVWQRYPVHGMEVFWYYRELLAILNQALRDDAHRALMGELGQAVRQLRGIVFENAQS